MCVYFDESRVWSVTDISCNVGEKCDFVLVG